MALFDSIHAYTQNTVWLMSFRKFKTGENFNWISGLCMHACMYTCTHVYTQSCTMTILSCSFVTFSAIVVDRQIYTQRFWGCGNMQASERYSNKKWNEKKNLHWYSRAFSFIAFVLFALLFERLDYNANNLLHVYTQG